MLDLERTVICKIFKYDNQNYEIFVPISEEIGLRPKNSLFCYHLHLHIRRLITSHKNKNPKSIPKYFFNPTCLFFFGQIDPISLMEEIKEDVLFDQKIKLFLL